MGNEMPTQSYLELLDENGNSKIYGASKMDSITVELHPGASKWT